MNKKRIIVAVDNSNFEWCWKTTIKNVAHNLPEFVFTIIRSDEFAEKLRNSPEFFNDFDLAHMRGYSSFCTTPDTVEKLPIPFISTVATGGKKLDVRFDTVEKTAKFGKALVVQNKIAMQEAYKRGYTNVYLIPNGVDIRLFCHKDRKRNKKHVIGCAANTKGSRSELKGVDFIMKACKSAGLEYREVNAENRLSHEQMADWYRELDFYLQPSDSEGCSNSVMEAMASGLPVMICENVGYHGEICRSGIDYHDGEVVFVERNADDIVKKLKILVANPLILERTVKNARKFACNHDWKHIARLYGQMFADVLKIPFVKPVAVKEAPKQEPPKPAPVKPGKSHYVAEVLEYFETREGKKYYPTQRYLIPAEQYEKSQDKVKVIE